MKFLAESLTMTFTLLLFFHCLHDLFFIFVRRSCKFSFISRYKYFFCFCCSIRPCMFDLYYFRVWKTFLLSQNPAFFHVNIKLFSKMTNFPIAVEHYTDLKFNFLWHYCYYVFQEVPRFSISFLLWTSQFLIPTMVLFMLFFKEIDIYLFE